MTARHAASLPVGSVVANAETVFIKASDRPEPSMPWTGTAGGAMYNNAYSDAEVDEYLAQGTQVLRVGTGQGQ